MRIVSWRKLALAAAILCTIASEAFAGRPRPWVCGDKAAFSSARPMIYEATAAGRHKWILSFMQFQMGGPNEGFASVAARELPRGGDPITGRLPAGRYFAVAVYRGANGYWPCPQNVQEEDRVKPGVIAILCFGEHSGSCPVKVTIKPDIASTAAPERAPSP